MSGEMKNPIRRKECGELLFQLSRTRSTGGTGMEGASNGWGRFQDGSLDCLRLSGTLFAVHRQGSNVAGDGVLTFERAG